MLGDYAVIIDNDLHTYTDSADIPAQFDRLVCCVPTLPPPPHTAAQHAEIDAMPALLANMIRRQHHACCRTYRRP